MTYLNIDLQDILLNVYTFYDNFMILMLIILMLWLNELLHPFNGKNLSCKLKKSSQFSMLDALLYTKFAIKSLRICLKSFPYL